MFTDMYSSVSLHCFPFLIFFPCFLLLLGHDQIVPFLIGEKPCQDSPSSFFAASAPCGRMSPLITELVPFSLYLDSLLFALLIHCIPLTIVLLARILDCPLINDLNYSSTDNVILLTRLI